nr:ribonuclease H-like domain-containing protein [Tanacetum cinerariifolium]
MANEEENHALVADDEVPTEFSLMVKSSSSSDNEVYDDSYCSKICRKSTENLNTKISKLYEELNDCEIDLYNYKRGLSQVKATLVKFKEHEVKYCERIRVLERDVEIRDNKIEYLKNELEQKLETLKEEKERVDGKLAGLLKPSKDLDNLIESQRSDKIKDGLGYSDVPPPPAQLYLSSKKDLSWTGLPDRVQRLERELKSRTPIQKVKRGRSGDEFPLPEEVPTASVILPLKIPTVDSKFPTAKSTLTVDLGNKGKDVKASACWIWRPKQNTSEQGPNYNGDSGCSRHMTGNISYLSEYEPYDGGYVSFGHGGGKITGKGIIKTDFKLNDDANVLLRTHRQHNMYSIDLNNIFPHKNLTCLVAKASVDESMLWHIRLSKSREDLYEEITSYVLML